MSSSRFVIALSFVLGTAACGGATPHTETTASPAPTASASPAPEDLGRPFAIAPLHLRSLPGAARQVDFELHADGTLTMNGTLAARIDGTRVVAADGTEAFSVGPDGVLSARGQRGRARLLANGDLVPLDDAEHQSRFEISEDGTPQERHADGRIEQLPARFEGITAETRRTAMAVTMFLLAATSEPSPAPAAEVRASEAPSASPAPASPAPTGTRRRRAH